MQTGKSRQIGRRAGEDEHWEPTSLFEDGVKARVENADLRQAHTEDWIIQGKTRFMPLLEADLI